VNSLPDHWMDKIFEEQDENAKAFDDDTNLE
jgi:hypothetical protein